MTPKRNPRTVDEDGRMNQPSERRDYTNKDNYDKEYDKEYNGIEQSEESDEIPDKDVRSLENPDLKIDKKDKLKKGPLK